MPGYCEYIKLQQINAVGKRRKHFKYWSLRPNIGCTCKYNNCKNNGFPTQNTYICMYEDRKSKHRETSHFYTGFMQDLNYGNSKVMDPHFQVPLLPAAL